jgi:hypothetical protein
MNRRLATLLAAGFSSVLTATAASAALPTCLDLGVNPAWGLAGNPTISGLSTVQMPATPAAGANPATPTYCDVKFTLSLLSGPSDGYATGQNQAIGIQIVLPEKAAWVGKILASSSPGTQGNSVIAAPLGEGIGGGGLTYSIRLGYIGTTTDAGHLGGGSSFGIIQASHTLNVGTLTDWKSRASALTTMMSKVIAKTYYGSYASRIYWNGCSGAGLQGMGQLQDYAEMYDGFLIGDPADAVDGEFLATAWPGAVIRDTLVAHGKTLTQGQYNAANASATAACDANDGVTDGIIQDPRACTYSAVGNICGAAGAPAAPNCLDADQAAAIDMIWDGPRNHLGKRIYYGWGKATPYTPSATPAAGFSSFVAALHHKDTTFSANNIYLNAATRAAAGNPPGSITYEDEATLGSNVVGDLTNDRDAQLKAALGRGGRTQIYGPGDHAVFNKLQFNGQPPVLDPLHNMGAKIIFFHGTNDPTIFYRDTPNYAAIQPWFRFYPVPGMGHCVTGPGSAGGGVMEPFLALVNWVENGVVPALVQAGGPVAGRTRPLCPYPTRSIYNGSGSTEDASNFHCGGNLDTPAVVADDALTALYKQENQ